MKPQDEYSQLLADYWDKPLSELPEALQTRITCDFIVSWDALTPDQREGQARQIDYDNDPKNAEEKTYYWNLVWEKD